ncbi:glycine betaine/L-proline ABC transporter, ATPase subunit [Dehalogenimonas lykanthroporepellens BL-DC-9]|jgi:osmoprotectant transport system ATP-binding protein|nr:glycine betaine/L-proline ABC transporter, ATPase subunit [Dehalogenimonas lykanthroporepellens BL-DC-9]
MIELVNLTKRYSPAASPAVDRLSLQVGDGEMVVIIGPSGCGKTTTLRMINRLIEPTSGRILIEGNDVTDRRPEELRRSIGYAIQSVGLFPHMTVAGNIAVVPQLLGWEKGRIDSRVRELLQLIGLKPDTYYAKFPYQLSGGEAQRIGVARALAADPPILLMDEPFGAVDPLTRETLQAQFVEIQRELKKTVILVTHDLDEAIRLADRIAIMRAGRLVQYDTPETVLRHPADRFVHDFVGTDRALKRLSRINIRPFIHQSSGIDVGASALEAEQACRTCRWIWVTDNGHLIGWLDRTSLAPGLAPAQVMERVVPDELAVRDSASFREALSRMLAQGIKNLPVIDRDGILLGEVRMGDIEKATAEGET